MGCCEVHRINDNTDIQFKTYYDPSLPSGYITTNSRANPTLRKTSEDRVGKLLKTNLNMDIPKTKEVKIPSFEIPIDIIRTKKRLSLIIIEAKFLIEGSVLNITPGGLEGSERMARDGIVCFGTKNDDNMNDFNFPEEDSIGKRHFEIKYDMLRDNYKIKNLFGSGLFVKIAKKIILRNNSIFSFSTSHIIVKISLDTGNQEEGTEATEDTIINSSICLKVIHGINECKEFVYDSKKKSKIKIGRFLANGIDISFGEESTSRLQCTIFYENNNWYIVDGDGIKISLNGTWYLADEYVDINEGMIFRAGTTSFQAHLYDP